MQPFPPVLSPNVLAARALNALLRREPWAAERLSRHAGKSLRFTVGAMRAGLSIEASGMLRPCDPAVVPDVSLTIPAEHIASLPGILRSRDVSAITDRLHVQGDAALATLVSELARDLRWDAEEDMAGVFGDVVGPRLWRGAQAARQLMAASAQRMAANVAEYLGEEGRVLVTRPAMESFRHDCGVLLQRLDDLERRVSRGAGASARG